VNQRQSIGPLKSTLMIVLLMLIATRLTWLQTSNISTDISPSTYKTGLLFVAKLQSFCRVDPEATFPLPASAAFNSNHLPVTPGNGEFAPGLLISMLIQCQFSRLEADKLASLNAWVFAMATFFCSIGVRIMTSSWTAGLAAAVVILSRGTLQSQAMHVSGDAYASALIAASWCLSLLFLRTLWIYWYLGATALAVTSCWFVPPLWPIGISCVLAPIILAARHSKVTLRDGLDFTPQPTRLPNPWSKASYNTLHLAASRAQWLYLAVAAMLLWGSSVIPMHLLFKDSGSSAWLHLTAASHKLRGASLRDLQLAWTDYFNVLSTYLTQLDFHAKAAVVSIIILPMTGGPIKMVNRSMSIIVLSSLFIVVFSALTHELLLTHFALPSRDSVLSVANTLEPLVMGLSTGTIWLLLDFFSGQRLSHSGWSIRRHGTIKT
jgi:hypothetical protein